MIEGIVDNQAFKISMVSKAAQYAEIGDIRLAECCLNSLPPQDRDYELVAMMAALSGSQIGAQYFLNNLPEDKRDYNRIACMAAKGGFREVAEHFLNMLPEGERHYNLVAAGAARGGKREVAEYFLNKLPQASRNYFLVSREALITGHVDLFRYFDTLDNLQYAQSLINTTMQEMPSDDTLEDTSNSSTPAQRYMLRLRNLSSTNPTASADETPNNRSARRRNS